MLMPASTFSASAASGFEDFFLNPKEMSSSRDSSPDIYRRRASVHSNSKSATTSTSSSRGSAGVDGCSTSTSSDTPGLGVGAITQKDTTWTKLFVGGLPYHTTDKSLRDHFKIYGEIEEAVVITDRQTGKSRGYGFVIMSERIAAERACKEPNPIIDGRKANVNLAILGAKPRGNAAATVADPFQSSYPLVYSQRTASNQILNQHSAFPFTAIRTGYPTQLLASQYGLPGSYVYQPAAYGGAPLLSLPSAATSPALAAAIAAQASQFYDSYQPANLASSGVAPGSAAAAAYPTAAHFAAQAAFAAADPYTSSYLAATSAGANHNAANAAAAQHHAAAAAYAAYIPQMAAGTMNSGNASVAAAAAAAANAGISLTPYAAVAQDSRMQ